MSWSIMFNILFEYKIQEKHKKNNIIQIAVMVAVTAGFVSFNKNFKLFLGLPITSHGA